MGAVRWVKPENSDPLQEKLGSLFIALNQKWWVDEIYEAVIIKPFRYLSDEILAKWFDQEVIDGSVNDIGGLARTLARLVNHFENGYARTYALSILMGAVLILSYLILK